MRPPLQLGLLSHLNFEPRKLGNVNLCREIFLTRIYSKILHRTLSFVPQSLSDVLA